MNNNDKKLKQINKKSKTSKQNIKKSKNIFLKWLPMIVLSAALMIIVIDTTVLNVSLKNIVIDINTDIQGIQWVITGYALTLAAFTITGGRLGDIFGRKKMFMVGAVIFALGSFVTSISQTLPILIVGEAIIEGMGAALMMPATASLLVANYKGKDRAIAFGIWGGIAGASSALGPILGGWLTTNYSWRWAFRINIVIAILLLIGARFIAESKEESEKNRLDLIGVVLSSLGLLIFVYGIIESSTYGWWLATKPYLLFGKDVLAGLSVTPFAIVLGVILLALFAVWENHLEKSGKTPLVSLGIFKNRQFTSGSVTVALLSLGMTGIIFALPVFFQSVQNLDALHTGLALVPMSLAVLISAPASAALTKYLTPKHIIQIGLLTSTIGGILIYLLLSPTATAIHLAPGLAFFGLGMGLVMAQASNMTLSAVSVEQSGEASGVNNTIRQIGTSLGSAIIGAVVLTSLASGLTNGVKNSTVIPKHMKQAISESVSSQASGIELGGTESDKSTHKLPENIKSELTTIAHQASADSSKKAMLYTSFFMLVALAVSSFMPNTRQLEKSQNLAAGH
jgi:EmrB/QacA subfamily drug resistance transporter